MAFAEDMGLFFNPTDFAVTASRTPAGGGTATPGNVILDTGDVEVDGLVIDGPSLAVPLSTWPTVAQGDSIAIGTTTYRVRAVVAQFDGAVARLQLAKA